MSSLTVSVLIVGCSSAFLIHDFDFNQTSSLSRQHASVEDSIRDLMALIVEEKKMRFQLETRLNAAESKIDKMHLYYLAVSDELEKQKIKVEQLETTCNDLTKQLDNNTFTDIYNMTGPQSMQTEMKRDITRLQEKLTQFNRTLMDTVLDTATQLQLINQSFVSAMGERDGFSVYKPYSNISGHNGSLMFQDMIYNETDVYNSTTGVFSCQRPGLYLFVFTAVKTNGISKVYCRFKKNDDQLLALSTAVIAEGGSYKFSSGTNSILLRLQVGDEVYITCSQKEFLAWETSFTGILISPVL